MQRLTRLDRSKLRIVARALGERRRWRRLPLRAKGRLLFDDGAEHDCELIDASPGGVSVAAPAAPRPKSRVILLVDGVGRLDCDVVRVGPRDFAAALRATSRKRDRLGDAITWAYNKDALGLDEPRADPRQFRLDVVMVSAGGETAQAELIDESIGGASLSCTMTPQVGAAVSVGGRPARVTRLHPCGFAVRFDSRDRCV